MMTSPDALAGLRLLPGFLDRTHQEQLLAEVHALLAHAPLFTPVMPGTGTPFTVRMTNCGPLGWVSDRNGYRYQPTHPVTGAPWPPMPEMLRRLWAEVSAFPHPPEACLVNSYGRSARMGLHQDRDEQEFGAPVVSVSLGASCRFRVGGHARTTPTRSFILGSGDVLVLSEAARLAFHGVDRIMPGTSTLLPDDRRINLTLRRVTAISRNP